MNCMLHFKKRFLVSIIFFLLPLVGGCSILAEIWNEDNPIYGKDTDERIIMCLEKAYPKHQFQVIESYDNSMREGVFADESGVKFKVTNVLYDNTYHFGCDDYYLYELLNQQGYVEKVEAIMKKYNLPVTWIIYPSIEVVLDANLDKQELANVVLEVLNCVEVPEVLWPEDTSFSTREVNYYTQPEWGIFGIEFENESTGIMFSVLYQFADKDLTVDEVVKRMDEEIQEAEKWYEEYYKPHIEASKSNVQGETEETLFGNYSIQQNWSQNEELSTEELYVYTANGVYPAQGDSNSITIICQYGNSGGLSDQCYRFYNRAGKCGVLF